MNEKEFEGLIKRLLAHDFSAHTASFRDSLLTRCFAVLDHGDQAEDAKNQSVGDAAAMLPDFDRAR